MDAGWYPDPNDPSRSNYWDGTQWTPGPPPVPARHKRNSRAWLLGGIGAAVVAIVVVIVVLATNGSSGSDRSLSTFCSEQQSFRTGLSHRVFTGLNPPSAADYTQVATELRKLAGEVPSTSVQHDLTVLADAADQASKTGSVFVGSPAVAAASNRIAAYVQQNCK